MAYKQKGMKFGEGAGEKGPKFNGLKKITPPRANAYESDEMEDEYETADNRPPNTRPPLFSDDAHEKTKKKVGAPYKKCGCDK